MTHGLLLHHASYAGRIDDELGRVLGLDRAHPCALRIPLDVQRETRFPWLFKGLTCARTNQVLNIISSASAHPLVKELNEEQLKALCVPYDAMPFVTLSGREDLTVAYSIAQLTSPLRTWFLGPEGVALYEKNLAYHYGPVYVFASKPVGDFDDLQLLPIRSDVEDILESLRHLNFGG